MRGSQCRLLQRFASTSVRARPFSSTGKYDPNVVNLCLDPPRGKPFPTVPLLASFGCFLLVTPLVAMYYDNQRFKVEMERRKQPGVRY